MGLISPDLNKRVIEEPHKRQVAPASADGVDHEMIDLSHTIEDGMVGIDSLNVDDTSIGKRPVHSVLLGAGIPVVEHMTNLGALPAAGFRFTAAPPRVKAMGTFPVRAHARLNRR